MQLERYKKIAGEFFLVLETGKRVSSRLVGFQTNATHLTYADPIFTKLLAHAISLYRLSPQLEETNVELWDMPSACAVARCIIEAHDVLEYIAFAAISEQDREFRLLVWKLHDQQRRSKMLHSMQSTHPEAMPIHNRAAELLNKVEAHPLFQTMNKSIQGHIRSGDAPAFLLSQRDRNVANGVNHQYHTVATMALSQYVHTLPMSVHQLFEFKAGTPEALHLSSMPIQYSLGFMARAIERMVETFPSGAVSLTPEQATVLSVWGAIVQDRVTPSPSSKGA